MRQQAATSVSNGTRAKRSLVVVAGLLGCLVVAAWLVTGALIAPVPREIGAPPPDLGARSVTFHGASGSTIHGWFAAGVPGGGAVLLLHGVRGDRRDMLARARFLHRLGYAVLLLDFQAHGESAGRQITFGHLESHDVTAGLIFLRETAPGERIGVIGVSLGAAAFVLAEPRPPPDAVVLESMYPTLELAVKDRLRLHLGPLGPVLAPLLLIQVRPRLGIPVSELRPIDRVGLIHAPVLIASGTQDRHTSIEEAMAVFGAARDPKSFWAVPGAAHVDLHAFATDEYERRISVFLDRYLRPRGTAAAGGG